MRRIMCRRHGQIRRFLEKILPYGTCSYYTLAFLTSNPFGRCSGAHVCPTPAIATVSHARTASRYTLSGLENDWSHTALLCGRNDAEILWRRRPPSRKCVWLGTSYGRAWSRRKAYRHPVSRCTIRQQWPQTLGRRAPPSGRSAVSPGRGSCPTRPDVSHGFGLYASDGPSGSGGVASPGL